MFIYLWVALGSALGGMGRYWLTGLMLVEESFPWGTLAVNVIGSLAIGFFFTLTGPDGRMMVNTASRQFFMVGFCGGFTTFSSFSLQTLTLVNDGQWFYAGLNIGSSVILCLLAVWLGHIIAAQVNTLTWI
ncbi:MAG: fluoride efflux transporter CrcB [Alphaproteobacteria bacterium]